MEHAVPTKRSKRSFKTTVGTTALGFLALGVALLVGIATSLVSFWRFSIYYGSQSSMWSRVVFAGWASRFVSLASLAIRVILGLQGGFCCSMLAGLIAETGWISLFLVPRVSLMRAAQPAPHKLFFSLTSNWQTGGSLLCYGLLAIITATTIASQFTSTILFGDFDFNSLARSEPEVLTPILTDDVETLHPFDKRPIWNHEPVIHSTFGRKTRRGSVQNGLDDSGEAVTALLPYPATTRRSLKSFEGNTTLLGTRFVCVAPEHRNVSHNVLFTSNDTYVGRYTRTLPLPRSTWWFSGQVLQPPNATAPLRTVPAWYNSGRDVALSFNCSMVFQSESPSGRVAAEWALGICNTDTTRSWIVPNPLAPERRDPSHDPDYYPTFLVYNVTGTEKQWRDVWELEWRWNRSVTQPWATMSCPLPDCGIGINYTVCFGTIAERDTHIRAARNRSTPDAGVFWDRTSKIIDTSSVLRLFDIPVRDASHSFGSLESGTMSLDFEVNEDGGVDPPSRTPQWRVSYSRNLRIEGSGEGEWRNGYFNPELLHFGKYFPWGSWIVCSNCSQESTFEGENSRVLVHWNYIALIQDVLKTSGSIAAALNTMWTVGVFSTYDVYFNRFNVETPVNATYFSEQYTPVRQVGLGVVVGIIGLHILSSLTILTLFIRNCTLTKMGNDWPMLSQTVTGEVTTVVGRTSGMTDTEVKESLLKREGLNQRAQLQAGSDGVGRFIVLR